VRRKSKLIVLVFIMNMLLAACSLGINDKNKDAGNTQSTDYYDIMDKGPSEGGILNVFSTNPDILNPLLTKNIYVQDFCGFIFEGLVKLEKDQSPTGVLAEKWSVSEDGLVWTINLRDNIKWHDGSAFTAEDVDFTFKLIMDAAFDTVYKKNLENVQSCAVVNSKTFSITLKNKDSFIIEKLSFPILQKKSFAEGSVFDKASTGNINPIGTGPFKFISSTAQNIKLEKNKEWWNSRNSISNLPDLPYLDGINVKIYYTANDSIKAFKEKAIDVTFIERQDIAKYNTRTDITYKKYEGRSYEYIAFNLSKAALSDKVVRQAIAYAIDKNAIIKELMPGEATAAEIPVFRDSWLYGGNTLSYTPDSQKAKTLLLQNGWKENDGVMYKVVSGNTLSLDFKLAVNEENDTRLKVAEIIAKQLKDIGIKVTIEKEKWDDKYAPVNLKSVATRKFDMALMGCRISTLPDISFAYASWEVPTGRNTAGYKSPEADNLLKQLMNGPGGEDRKIAFNGLRSRLLDDIPYMGLYFYNSAAIYNKRVRGDIAPTGWNRYNNIVKWYKLPG